MRYSEGVFQDNQCFIRKVDADWVILMTRDGLAVQHYRNCVRVDKFEWERLIPLADVVILPPK